MSKFKTWGGGHKLFSVEMTTDLEEGLAWPREIATEIASCTVHEGGKQDV